MTLEKGRLGDEHLQDVHAQLLREKDEPTEGFSPVPIFFLFIFCALVFWGGIYLERYSGEFTAYAFDPEYRDSDTSEAPVIDYTSPEWLISQGERKYNQNCAACHQASGVGVAGVFPPLVDSRWVTGDPERTINIVLYGLQGEIEVKGETYNGVMTPFGNHPSFRNDRDIAAVVSYIRNAWGNSASYVTAEEVTAVRNREGERGSWNGSELLEVYPLITE